MTNLMDLIKIAMGRKLSDAQMKNAIPKECTMDFEHYISSVRKKVSEIHKYTDNKFAWFTTISTNYSIEKAIKKEYNEQGLLTGKMINYNPETHASWRTIIYSPPGRFFGKIDNERSTY
jgi:hypothetical protein